MKRFGLTHKVLQDKDNWRLRIKGPTGRGAGGQVYVENGR